MTTIQTAPAGNRSNDEFSRNFMQTAAICMVLALLPVALTYSNKVPGLSRLNELYWQIRYGGMSEDDLNVMAAGYYEGIENKTHLQMGDWNTRRDDYVFRDDLLRYEMKPNLHHAYGDGLRITNSHGLASPEYGFEKPPHTYRIAIMGDSVSIGPYGHSYEQLLEHKLNECCITKDIQQYQVLNFSVPGYHLIQKMDLALGMTKQYHPDVYVVAMTGHDKDGLILWLAGLTESGTDLKYDFLKRIEAQAGVERTDRRFTVARKLRPFRQQISTWALEQVRDSAQAQGAKTVVFLIPFADGLQAQENVFRQFDQLVSATGIPVVDAGRAYRSVEDLTKIQIDPPEDMHPNIRGNELIFSELLSRLQAQPDAMNILLGRP